MVPEDGFLRGLRAHLRRARHPAHRRRGPVGRRAARGRMWAVEHEGVEPDIVLVGQGHRQRHAAGGDDRPRPAARGLGTGRPRLDVRRQPGRLRCGAGHARPARGRVDRERRRAGRPGDGTAGRCWRTAIPGSCATSVVEGLMIGRRAGHARPRRGGPVGLLPRGLLVLECGRSTVRLSPPLVVSAAEVDTAMRLFAEAVGLVAGRARRGPCRGHRRGRHDGGRRGDLIRTLAGRWARAAGAPGAPRRMGRQGRDGSQRRARLPPFGRTGRGTADGTSGARPVAASGAAAAARAVTLAWR